MAHPMVLRGATLLAAPTANWVSGENIRIWKIRDWRLSGKSADRLKTGAFFLVAETAARGRKRRKCRAFSETPEMAPRRPHLVAGAPSIIVGRN